MGGGIFLLWLSFFKGNIIFYNAKVLNVSSFQRKVYTSMYFLKTIQVMLAMITNYVNKDELKMIRTTQALYDRL